MGEQLSSVQIQMRDPFVLPVLEERKYYLYGTTDKWCWSGPGTGFDCYTSSDLRTWAGPIPAFRPPERFWGDTQFWAPEVHRYRGRYYMFASFKNGSVCRGTQVLVADHPSGPFKTHSDGPVTPCDWECLDGTLYVEGGVPWIIYCHEWVQIRDGAIYAQRLQPDLRRTDGKPVRLFNASEAPWVRKGPGPIELITDGPFMHQCADGQLLMLWSSFGPCAYAIGVARSLSGKVTGPWTQSKMPLFDCDGGHGMTFRSFDGQLLYLTIHAPNDTPNERPMFWPVFEERGNLILQNGRTSVFPNCLAKLSENCGVSRSGASEVLR